MINIFVIFVLLIGIAQSIKFGLEIGPHGVQCFQENVEQQTRYQILVKGNTSQFYFHVSQGQKSLHDDSRTSSNLQYKYFSAFAQTNGQINFCIGNIGQGSIRVQIEFYHGLHLQDSPQDMKQLSDIGLRIQQMKQFIKRNYDQYGQALAAKHTKSSKFGDWITIATIIIVFGSAIVQYLLFKKISKYLKYKKII